MTEKALEPIVKRFKCDSVANLGTAVGQGHFTGREVVTAVFPGTKPDAKVQKVVPIARARARQGKGRETSVPIKGLIPGMAVHYANCCHTLPGDRIVGIVTTGKGVTVHTIDCDTQESFQATPERWVDLSWAVEEGHDQRIGRLHAGL